MEECQWKDENKLVKLKEKLLKIPPSVLVVFLVNLSILKSYKNLINKSDPEQLKGMRSSPLEQCWPHHGTWSWEDDRGPSIWHFSGTGVDVDAWNGGTMI